MTSSAVVNAVSGAAGASARKMAERVGWCYYIVVPESALTDATTAANAGRKGTKTVSFNLTY